MFSFEKCLFNRFLFIFQLDCVFFSVELYEFLVFVFNLSLLDRRIENIFSHSIVSFSFCWLFLFLSRRFLFAIVTAYFCFCCLHIGHHIWKTIVNTTVKEVLSMFSSKTFIVLKLRFKYLIYIEIIFISSGRKKSNFILLHVTVQFSQHHLLKGLSFPHWIFLTPLSNIIWLYMHSFWTLISVLLVNISLLMLILLFLIYWSIVALQCFARFRYTTKWISYMHTHINSFRLFSHIGHCRVLCRVPYTI